LNYIQRELYNRKSKATPLNPIFTNKDKAEVTVKHRYKDRDRWKDSTGKIQYSRPYMKDHWVKEIFEKAMSKYDKRDFIQ